ncbi:MAG TPA: PA0069 family radical SAM protein [Steroidobacteraceae bacterium]|nr:PA0069 family radical SAM protein [Steroidobacteraceae bacterium]
MPIDPGIRKGRGAGSNPEGRFESRRTEAVDDGWPQELADELPPLETTLTPEHAKHVITRNNSPDIAFEQSINPYRGCEHGCVYCLGGETQILMGDGTTKAIADIRLGDEIYGTEKRGHYRRYVKTTVLAHWSTRKPAHRVCLADGTEVIASADHRFLTERGWKFVAQGGGGQRPYLTRNNSLMGFGLVRTSSCTESAAYRRGYLCGVIRGDGRIGAYHYQGPGRSHGDQYRFRLAMIDGEPLERTRRYLAEFGIGTDVFLFQAERPNRRRIEAIRTSARASVEAIQSLIQWPDRTDDEWTQGFAAGIYDAEGSFGDGILRIANADTRMIETTTIALSRLGFDAVVEMTRARLSRPMYYVRVRGGLRAHLRFMQSCNPAIARKRCVTGQAVKSRAELDVVAVEGLDERQLFDITTGTGDFIANGVISHNCYARPAHAYMNLSPGLDFETKIFYKSRAAQLLEDELTKPGYVCKPINLGANTDPYQPAERKLRVTRSVLEVLQRFRHPLTIVTKSALVERDIDILADMARDALVSVFVSITTLDPALKRGLEPRAPAPLARLGAVRKLNDAGIPVGVFVAPIIPAVNDHEIEAILEACAQAGARTAGYVMLRLPYEVKDLFREWLANHLPERADHVMSLIRAMRDGKDNDPRFGSRMKGQGAYAELIGRRFAVCSRRLGLDRGRALQLSTCHFRSRAAAGGQLDLI